MVRKGKRFMRNSNILPEKLKPGDVIGIVSPSEPIRAEHGAYYAAGVAWLERQGFVVREGSHVRVMPTGEDPDGAQKAADLNRMFADPEVKAIICSQGGDSAQECLPYIDWDGIRRHPKIFTGISDITVLLNAIYQETGLVTFHGNDVIWGFGRKPQEYDRNEFVGRLVDGAIGEIPAYRERLVVREGRAEGRLVGGNLRCLLKLADTSYFPDTKGAILFVEALKITPEISEGYFDALDREGVFEQINGAIVGYIHSAQKDGDLDSPMEKVLASKSAGYDFPILKVNDFGHICPNTVLPVGGLVRMDTNDRSIEILEKCVR